VRAARHLYLLLVPLVPVLQARIDARLGRFRAQEEALYLWSGRQVRRLVPGFESLAADVYWLRTVQYFGGQRVFARDTRLELLSPLIDITVTLDPRMEIAYRYGATFLSEPPPAGAGRAEEGIRLLERGVRELPQSWRLRQQLGFFHFIFGRDPRKAAEVLVEAARIPGAAYWLETMAADILARGGERQLARRMWRQMYEQSEEGALRANALVHLMALDARDAAESLTGRVAEFARRAGRRPRTLEELRAAGLWPGRLVDPAGFPFDYDAAAGVVSVSRQSSLWRPE
jgi:hypothetical protein